MFSSKSYPLNLLGFVCLMISINSCRQRPGTLRFEGTVSNGQAVDNLYIAEAKKYNDQKFIQAYKDVFLKKCLNCHKNQNPKLATYKELLELSKKDEDGFSLLEEVVINDYMPPAQPLTDKEKYIISSWISSIPRKEKVSDPYLKAADKAKDRLFSDVYKKIFKVSCIGCHQDQEVQFNSYEALLKNSKKDKSGWSNILEEVEENYMPPERPLNNKLKDLLRDWIDSLE